MEITRFSTRLAALAALAWGSACGGNVVVDGMPDGSGGAGATSAVGVGVTSSSAVGVGVTSTSASWMTTSAVTSSSTGVGGGDARSTCARYCELFEGRCGAVPADCSAICDAWFGEAPACNELLLSYLECAIDDLDQCDFFPIACERYLGEYAACASDPDCAPLACASEGNRTCDCKASCHGVALSFECRPGGPGVVVCSCLIDGAEVFACEGRGPACTLAQDCCGPILDGLR
ncbi:hypothetical protein WMF18_25385 [Sorangium sp. So ce315]|uniref:hypothetical protein n=1 Tax=Sorangium sp. So ce315 TaxID=3133299 RepID=UPI003F60953E